MKNIKKIKISQLFLLCFLLLGITSCEKSSKLLSAETAARSATQIDFKKLREYKNSKHKLMAGYYRTWRDIVAYPKENKTSMLKLPDSLDIVCIFNDYTPIGNPFWETLKYIYVPYLRERGTKIVMTIDVGHLLDKNYPNTKEGHKALAEKIIAEKVTKYGLDGLDIDVERYFQSDDVEQIAGVFVQLARYLGPLSGTGKLLIYDTNQNGNTPLINEVYDCVNYVFAQSYGLTYDGIQSIYNTYSTIIPPENYFIGYSNYEENGYKYYDVTWPLVDSRACYYAKWNPSEGSKAGLFEFALDRDGVKEGEDQIVTTNYDVTRLLISTMNPPK